MDSSQNNPFGSFSSGGAGPSGFSAPVSSGAGDDIILSGTTPKKSNMKLIIGIVVGVILLIGAVAGFLMMQGKKGGSGASETSKEEFNRYANYLLYGEESSVELKGQDGAEDTAKVFSILDEDSKVMIPYGEKMKTYWGDFYGGIDQFELDNGVTRDAYNERVGFVADYFRNSLKIDTTKIINLMKTEKFEQVSQEVKNYFALFDKYNFDEAKEYVEKGSNYYNGLISLMQSAKNMGCDLSSESSETTTTCDEEALLNSNESYKDMDKNYAEMDTAVYNVTQYLVANGWKINSFLNGGEK